MSSASASTAPASPERPTPGPGHRLTRLVFLGSPPVAAATLRALVDAGHDVAAVVTQSDRKRGRGGELSPTPVKAVALEQGIAVTHRVRDVPSFDAELGVVVAFGRIIPADVLAELPMVNLHLSLLPRWRGAAPVERAILAGDPESGVSLMSLDEGLDTGPVFRRIAVPIGPEETAGELVERLGRLGTEALLDALADGPAGLGTPVPQAGEPTYAEKLTPKDHHLDFTRSAVQCHRVVRIGRAWTTFRGRRFIVHAAHVEPGGSGEEPGTLVGNRVATGDGVLVLEEIQSEGRARQPFELFASGARLQPGERLGAATP